MDTKEEKKIVKAEDGRLVLVDKDGNAVVPCKWQNIHQVWPNSWGPKLFAAGNDKGKYCLLDEHGDELTEYLWDEVLGVYYYNDEGVKYRYHEDLDETETKYCERNCKFGIMEPGGYFTPLAEDEELVLVRNGQYWGIIFVKWNPQPIFDGYMTPCQWKEIDRVLGLLDDCQGRFRVSDANGYKGLIDKYTGAVVTPCQWKKITKLHNSKDFIVQDATEKWGVIAQDGNMVIPCRWKSIEDFPHLDQFKVKDFDGGIGVLDRQGNEVLKPGQWVSYQYLCDMQLYKVEDDKGLFGFTDRNGKVLQPCRYESVECVCDDLFIVKDVNGKSGTLDKNGNIVEVKKVIEKENETDNK